MPKKKPRSKPSRSKIRAKSKKKAAKANARQPKQSTRRKRRATRGGAQSGALVDYTARSASSGGQAGDTQGLPASEGVDMESVKELIEEGQSFEAEIVEAVENAPDPDQRKLRTRERPEDDVADEYRNVDERDVG